MNNPLLLNGQIDTRDDEIAELREQLQQLSEELQIERNKNRAIEAGLRGFRHVTKPLLEALQQSHGMIEHMGISDSPNGSSTGQQSKYEAIKARLAPRLKEAVDILLIQGAMRRTQLAAALKMDYSNCTKNVIGVLLRQGIIVENNRELTLKQF